MAATGARYTAAAGRGAPAQRLRRFLRRQRRHLLARLVSSTTPLLWDFYRNAVSQPDQLRQRVALALQQIVVVSNLEVFGTYGLRGYHNMLLERAFGNYREMLAQR